MRLGSFLTIENEEGEYTIEYDVLCDLEIEYDLLGTLLSTHLNFCTITGHGFVYGLVPRKYDFRIGNVLYSHNLPKAVWKALAERVQMEAYDYIRERQYRERGHKNNYVLRKQEI